MNQLASYLLNNRSPRRIQKWMTFIERRVGHVEVITKEKEGNSGAKTSSLLGGQARIISCRLSLLFLEKSGEGQPI